MEAASAAQPAAIEKPDKGLDANAIGFVDAVVIGLASTAPAYSLAAVIGTTAVLVGVQAPAVLLASFVPMFLIATAFYYLSRADQGCGTTFAWGTRALGPWLGWIGGWAVCTTGVLVIGSLADVGARYTYLLFEWDSAAESKAAVMGLAVAIIVVMTAICVIGTELSARVQNVMIVAQVGALLLFAGWAIAKVIGNEAPAESIDPSLSWLNPFEIESGTALTGGLLLGVFIYWGWESAVNLTEEVGGSPSAPGVAAVLSTVILLVTYVAVSIAVVAYAGLELLAEFDDDDAIFSTMAGDVLPGSLDKLVILAIVTSAIASTQTTILPASRTILSMATQSALPKLLGRVHRRFHTPHVSTWWIGVSAIAWYVPVNIASENFLFDSLSALSLMIAFYYALTGIACAVYFRNVLLKSVRNLVFIGIAPLIGAGILIWLLVESVSDLADPENSYTGSEILGMGTPLAIGVLFMALGVILMVAWRIRNDRAFWGRRRETVSGELAAELDGNV